MLEFLLQEEWWMETIIASCITAAVTLIASYFAYLGKLKNMEGKLDSLLGEKYNLLREDGKGLTSGHDKLSQGHDKLSQEHDKLSQEHDKLSQEHDRLREKIDKIYMNQKIEKASREASAKYIPEEGKLFDLVRMVYDNHDRLLKEIEALQKENWQLKKELQQYKQQAVQLDDLDSLAENEEFYQDEQEM